MTRRERKGAVLQSSALMMFILAAVAQPQPAVAQEAVLEEIVVKARKREENLQEVPASIVAIPAETIERANIVAARDVTTRIPNVSLVESLSPTSTYIIVRGIAATRNSEPAVSMVVDGVQVGSATEISQSFFDVEQIELLKGPQGSLYGRNALGGALIINSKQPTDEFTGRVSAGTGNGGLFELNGSVSAPISDELFFRFAANHRSFDGTLENHYLSGVYDRTSRANSGSVPGSAYMDFEESNDYRAQILWMPGDNAQISLSYAKNSLESGSMWYRNIYRLESDENVEYEFPINSNGNPTAVRDIDTLTLKIDYDTEWGTITSITNYTDTSERYGVAGETRGNDRTGNVLFYTEPFVNDFINGLADPVDADFFSAQLGAWADGNFVGSDQYYDVETVSQELRFVSDESDRLRYVGGLYFLKTERYDTIRSTWEVPQGQPFDCPPTYPGGPIVTDFATCSGLIDSTQNSQDNSAWAAFLNADFDINDQWTMTLAARYDRDDREVTRIDGPTVDTFGLGVGSCDSVADPDNCSAAGTQLDRSFSEFQPKVSLAYRPFDTGGANDMTLYATYARGFRSGGFNASGALLTDSYDHETLDSYEIGLKWTGMGGRLRTNFAGFYQDYKNAQQFAFDGNIFVQSLYNIPESKITGIEGSLDMLLTDNLILSAAFGVMDSEITRFDPEILQRMEFELTDRTANTVKLPAGTQSAFDAGFIGYNLPLFAHKSANVGLQHELPVGNMTMTSRVDYSYSGDVYWWIDGQDVQEDLHLIEASVGFEIAEGLEIQAWCKNCTNKTYDSEYAPQEKELFGGAAKDVAYQARLRTYGLRATYRF